MEALEIKAGFVITTDTLNGQVLNVTDISEETRKELVSKREVIFDKIKIMDSSGNWRRSGPFTILSTTYTPCHKHATVVVRGKVSSLD